MSGRRYIIHSSLLLPDTAPTTQAAFEKCTEKVRKFYRNAAIAVEYETHPDVATIINTLKGHPLTTEQLQYLLDKSHD